MRHKVQVLFFVMSIIVVLSGELSAATVVKHSGLESDAKGSCALIEREYKPQYPVRGISASGVGSLDIVLGDESFVRVQTDAESIDLPSIRFKESLRSGSYLYLMQRYPIKKGPCEPKVNYTVGLRCADYPGKRLCISTSLPTCLSNASSDAFRIGMFSVYVCDYMRMYMKSFGSFISDANIRVSGKALLTNTSTGPLVLQSIQAPRGDVTVCNEGFVWIKSGRIDKLQCTAEKFGTAELASVAVQKLSVSAKGGSSVAAHVKERAEGVVSSHATLFKSGTGSDVGVITNSKHACATFSYSTFSYSKDR